MTEILQSPSPIPSSPSSSINNDGLHQQTHDPIFNSPTSCFSVAPKYKGNNTDGEEGRKRKEREKEEGDQLSLLAVLVTVFRKSVIACRSESVEDFSSSMEIGLPTNVRHVAHVTFDRFNGFLGLPVEFEPDVPRRPPSASTSVFGVSTESMQLSFDSRGNSVPTILLMMQNRLYAQGGLQAEGIFRINAENGQEESVREQLNTGVVPDNIDMHCLAGLIKAWFRELPNGLLDSLPPEEVMQAQSEEECAELVRRLPPTEAALLDWAINLMADVAQLENVNKMSARNIAMVFAPNMTQMADPLTALMHAVQVMNFLKTLVAKTLREREDLILEEAPPPSCIEPSDDNGHQGSLLPRFDEADDELNEEEEDQFFAAHEHIPETSPTHPSSEDSKIQKDEHGLLNSIENVPGGKSHLVEEDGVSNTSYRNVPRKTQKRNSSQKKRHKKGGDCLVARAMSYGEKSREIGIASRLNLTTDRVETWR